MGVSIPTVHVGRSYDVYRGRVDADAAIAFALATNDPNDVYISGQAVPPLFTVSLILPAYSEAQRLSADPGAIRQVRGGLAAGHDVYLLHPLRPGMAVEWRATTYSARQTSAGVVVTERVAVSDLEGTLLVEHFWSSLRIGGIIAGDAGPPAGDHLFPDGARDRLIGTYTVDVAADQSFRYAGVSNDHNAHSLDDEAARREGLPGKIVQGMCTLSICGGGIVKIGADGDPRLLRRLAGRFSSPVFPRHPLVVEIFDAGATPDGGRALAFEATQRGTTVIKHGRAELRPARTP
jgi:acyl dehydratase